MSQLEAHRDVSAPRDIRLSKSAHPREAETSLKLETIPDTTLPLLSFSVTHSGLIRLTLMPWESFLPDQNCTDSPSRRVDTICETSAKWQVQCHFPWHAQAMSMPGESRPDYKSAVEHFRV